MRQSPPKPQPSWSDSEATPVAAEDVLALEYEILNEWARHGEEAAHRIFNFYVSLLIATLGGFLLVAQTLDQSIQAVLLTASAVCGLLVLVGVTFLDALISQYVRNAHYRIGLEKIRADFRRHATVARVLSELPRLTLEADVVSGRPSPVGELGRVDPRRSITGPLQRVARVVKLTLPVSAQQIFLSMTNSLLLGALVWIIHSVPQCPQPSLRVSVTQTQ